MMQSGDRILFEEVPQGPVVPGGAVGTQPPLVNPILGPTNPLPSEYGGTGVSSASANRVFAGPPSGPAAPPAFRALVNADLPADLQLRSVALLPGQWRLLLVQEAQSGIFQRWYLTDTGDLYVSYNASHDNATGLWSQDDSGTDSWVSWLAWGTMRLRRKVAGTSPWNDVSWDAEDAWYGSYLESSTTRVYDFGIWFSVRTVGDYVGNSIQFPVEFPSTPTSLTLSFTATNGVNTASAYCWSPTRRGTQWGIQSTAFTGWATGQLIVGF
jgi:hypothetical protein